MLLLEAQNINKTFPAKSGELNVLKNCSLIIESGISTSITGLSGSGKSTLLNLLTGLDGITSGQLKYKNEDMLKWSADEFALWRRENIGFVFQFHFLLPDFTALENVLIPAHISGKPDGECIDLAKKLLSQLGLAERMDHLPGELSGGEQQRVAIARAFINKPEIIFADEPFGNLDMQRSEQLAELLFQLAQQYSSTLVIVTHDNKLADQTDVSLKLESGSLISV